MAASDHISPEQFAEHKARADRTGKAQRVAGTDIYVGASKASKDARKQGVRDYHASLEPMKETVRNAGLHFSELSGHLKENADEIGAPRGKRQALKWAVDLHAKDPKNFIKNVGLIK